MNTTHTRTKRLLVTAIGAAIVGISVAAAPAAVAENGGPNGCDCADSHIPVTPWEMHGNLNPQPRQQPAKLPGNQLPPGGKPNPGGVKSPPCDPCAK